MECRARVLQRRGRGCVAGVPGAVGPARSPSGFAVPSGPGEPVLVPEGGGPPARSPHASLRLGVVDLEARPGPAAALRHPECTSARRHPPHWWRGCVVGGQALRFRRHPPHCPAVPLAPFTLVARVCRERPGPAASFRHRGRGCVAGVPGAVGPARPLAVRAASLRLGASARSPARPCGPAGTLCAGGAGVSWAARPCRRPQAPGMHLGTTAPSTPVAWVCRGRPGPNVADPRPRRRITVHTTACAKNVTD